MGAWNYHDHLNPTLRGTITVGEATEDDDEVLSEEVDEEITITSVSAEPLKKTNIFQALAGQSKIFSRGWYGYLENKKYR